MKGAPLTSSSGACHWPEGLVALPCQVISLTCRSLTTGTCTAARQPASQPASQPGRERASLIFLLPHISFLHTSLYSILLLTSTFLVYTPSLHLQTTSICIDCIVEPTFNIDTRPSVSQPKVA